MDRVPQYSVFGKMKPRKTRYYRYNVKYCNAVDTDLDP
jgi:hypothetical protein